MDSENHEQADLPAQASRARTILFLVMAALIASPFVAYVLFAKAGAPRP